MVLGGCLGGDGRRDRDDSVWSVRRVDEFVCAKDGSTRELELKLTTESPTQGSKCCMLCCPIICKVVKLQQKWKREAGCSIRVSKWC